MGGTGKTPITLWLARALTARGLRVAILSRGYGGRGARGRRWCRGATARRLDSMTVGDEAVMLAKCFDGLVLTARRRIDGPSPRPTARVSRSSCSTTAFSTAPWRATSIWC